MSKQFYVARNFAPASLELISTMETIIEDYVAQGYRLTVRQLYYQLVARAVVENTERSYKRVTGLVNDAKLAGLLDWEAIEDRTREFIRRTRWDSAAQIVRASADSFHMDHWQGQRERVFVIVEKEALAGVLQRASHDYDVPLLAARGYPSGTVLREFCVADIMGAMNEGQNVTILHLGDHDPSGVDMTRDLRERVALFSEKLVSLVRIALTMPQIKKQKPPPNPAKASDSRFDSYKRLFGTESWELDALKPDFLDNLVRKHINEHIDPSIWKARHEEIEDIRRRLTAAADTFEEGEV